MDKNKLLQHLNDAILNDDVLHQIEDMANETILMHKHPYKLTELPNGRWQSYFKENQKSERVCIRAKSRRELINKLADLYTDSEDVSKITMNMLFEEWLEYKRQYAGSPNTIRRHEQHYNKYFKDTKLFKQRVCKVDLLDMEVLCNGIIKDNNMTRKEWTNVKTILIGMFRYAERKHYIVSNPMNSLEVKVKFRQTNKKHGSVETFNADERSSLIHYMDEHYNEEHDPVFVAVRVNMMLGLRVSELVALKWGDIVDNKKLHVVRGEVRNQAKGIYEVVEHTKVHRDRFVDIPNQALGLFQKLRSASAKTRDDDFIFVRDGKRLTARQVTYALEKYARRCGKEVKRSHKLRKTYASVLSVNGVPVDEIRRQLGHSNLNTTLAYIYNPIAEDITHKLISGCFDEC